MHVPDLFGHLPWDLISSNRLFVGLLAVSEVVSDVDERQGDPEPHGAHRQHCREGNCAARVLAPDEEVDEDPE